MKLFGSGRTKEREVIKKQNGMSALIDTELDRGNGKTGARGERGRGDTNCREKNGTFKFVYVCVPPHGGPAEKLKSV